MSTGTTACPKAQLQGAHLQDAVQVEPGPVQVLEAAGQAGGAAKWRDVTQRGDISAVRAVACVLPPTTCRSGPGHPAFGPTCGP